MREAETVDDLPSEMEIDCEESGVNDDEVVRSLDSETETVDVTETSELMEVVALLVLGNVGV